MTPFKNIAVLLLGFIAIVQAIRFAFGWPVSINGLAVPTWASAIAALVIGFIAFKLWREGRR